MVFEGESLTVILWLASAALATMIGARTVTPGWRANTLWVMTFVFGASCVGWVLAPAANPVIQAISPFVVALVDSNALVMIGIVGVVALMIGGRPQNRAPLSQEEADGGSGEPALPLFAAVTESQSKWLPDISFAEAANYLLMESTWRSTYGMGGENERDLIEALGKSKVTAWGKAHPDDEGHVQIMRSFWPSAVVTTQTNFAFSNNRNVGAFDVRLSRGEIELVWPPRAQRA